MPPRCPLALVPELVARWRTLPDGHALLEVGGLALDAPALLARVRRAAGWLCAEGLGAGDRLALRTGREPAFLELHLAAAALGAATLPLNPRGTAAEAAWQLDDASPALAVVDDPALLAPGRVLARGLGDALAAAEPIALPGVDEGGGPGDDDDLLLLYTSGTTGRPKGARITHRNVLATATALIDAWRVTSADVLLHTLPLFHVHGLVVAQHVPLLAGATTVWHDGFDAPRVVDAIRARRVTVFMGVPTSYHRLLALPDPGPLPSMRLWTSGSAPLPAEAHRTFRARFGHDIVERYGMTEIGIVVSNPYDGDRVPGSIGLPLPGVALRIVDPDTGREVGEGEVGELRVRGPSVFAGYLGRPDATAEALVDGELRTGDLGHRDARGYVTLVGRRSELVLVGGFNVYPAEVEAALREHPAVAEAAVLGIPDADLGERVVATVVPEAVVDGEALRAFLRERLSAYKVPRHVAIADELPRTALGKVRKDELRRRWTHVEVAPATVDEADRIAAWNVALALESEGLALDPEVARAGARHAFDRPDVRYRTARVHDLPVGQCLVTTEWSDWRDREVWWIHSVWVEPAWRRRGVLRALLAAVEVEARASGVAGLRLYVDRRNTVACAAYERLGMSAEHYACYERMLDPVPEDRR